MVTDFRLLTAASKAQKLLETYDIRRPSEIELDDVAWALGIQITSAPLGGAVAHLVRIGDTGTITISDSIKDTGRRRFAVAHELGHWELHKAISQKFFCSSADMRQYQASGPEIEANIFASELLLPRSMLDPSLLKVEPRMDILFSWAREFNVSLASAAVRYAGASRQPVMAVFSDGIRVQWWRRNSRLDTLWVENDQRLGEDCVAADLGVNPKQAGLMVQVEWAAWFPHIPDRGEEVFECSVRVNSFQTVSLLWVPSRY